MIAERTLKKWRKEALESVQLPSFAEQGSNAMTMMELMLDELHLRILRMSQELLDQHLLKK